MTKLTDLTKREWFAGMALQGMLCNGFMPAKYLKTTTMSGQEWDYVKVAYALADDMLDASARLHSDPE